MALVRFFRSMPNAVFALFVIFLAVPIWSFSFMPSLDQIRQTYSPANIAVFVATFWIVPLGLCLLMARRSFLFIPLFALEALALLYHAMSSPSRGDSDLQVVRFVMIGLMMGIGVLFFNKDFFFPFFSRKSRFWRHNARLLANATMQLKTNEGKKLPVVMEDCSPGGFCVAGSLEELEQALGDVKGQTLVLALTYKGKVYEMAGTVSWCRDDARFRRIGVSLLDPKQIETVFRVVTAQQGGGSTFGVLNVLWHKTAVRRGVLTLWFGSIAGSYATPACKPKGADATSLTAIEGVDASQRGVAMSLVPVRNFFDARLTAQSPRSSQALAMLQARLFAQIECRDSLAASGAKVSAAELMSVVEWRSAIDDLYLDGERFLLSSADDQNLADYGRGGKLVRLPCRLVGNRLVSWPVLADVQIRAAGIPNKEVAGASADRVQSIYQLAQALHLSLRGSYAQDASDDFMPQLAAAADMLSAQAGVEANAVEMTARMRQADRIYNICDARALPESLGYLGSLKNKNYRCVSTYRSGVFNYRAGSDGSGYEKVKALLASEIAGTHQAVFKLTEGQDPELFALWDMLTSTRPFRQSAGRFGEALARGKVDLGEIFGGGGEARTADADRFDSRHPAAPLALGLAKGDGRIVRIASGSGKDLFQGAPGSVNERGRTAASRIQALEPILGGAGSRRLTTLGNEIDKVMATIRKKTSDVAH